MDSEIDKVLVVTDLSSHALSLFEQAADIARKHDSEVVLIHIVEPLPLGVARWYEPSRLLEQYAEDARNKLEKLERHALAVYPRCRSELHFGPVFQIVVDLARKLRPKLVLISARRRTGITRLLFRGLAERLERHSSCPVLVVECDNSSKTLAYGSETIEKINLPKETAPNSSFLPCPGAGVTQQTRTSRAQSPLSNM